MASEKYMLVPREPSVYGFVERVIAESDGQVNAGELLRRAEERFKYKPVFLMTREVMENTFYGKEHLQKNYKVYSIRNKVIVRPSLKPQKWPMAEC